MNGRWQYDKEIVIKTLLLSFKSLKTIASYYHKEHFI